MSATFKKGDRVTGIVEAVAKNYTGRHTICVLVKWPWAVALSCDSVDPSAIKLVPSPKPTLAEIARPEHVFEDEHGVRHVHSGAICDTITFLSNVCATGRCSLPRAVEIAHNAMRDGVYEAMS